MDRLGFWMKKAGQSMGNGLDFVLGMDGWMGRIRYWVKIQG